MSFTNAPVLDRATRATKATNSPVRSNRPPCAEGPNDWDLDIGTPDAWRAAVEVCRSCPLLTECAQLAQGFIDRGDAPRSMIWAGVPYDNSGKIVENLDRHRIAPFDRKRPMRIIRTSPSPSHHELVSSAPRRHLVLGQQLRPTGTDGG
ncbi:hypothetical protein ACFXPS_38860 [Nocardia sp. NPDC059091]|uniref:hypothetical protein n=1 Tax=unclassified Nocardia TaxID=2637762 RepID=UPI0036A9FDD5